MWQACAQQQANPARMHLESADVNEQDRVHLYEGR